MKDKIRKMLRESDFDWTEDSSGDEFYKKIQKRLGSYTSDTSILDDLLPFITSLPISEQGDIIDILESAFDGIRTEAKTEGYDEGYDEGCDNGYDEGRDSGYDRGYQDGYDTGFDDGKNEGYQDGYNEAQEECDD